MNANSKLIGLLGSVVMSAALASCGSDGGGNGTGGSGGTGGTDTGGSGGSTAGGSTAGGSTAGGSTAGGSTAGGSGGTGGSGIGGSGGSQSGGAAGAPNGGAGGGTAFWTDTYNGSALPDPQDGNHNGGKNCLGCHDGSNGAAPEFLYAGTVYEADGTTPAVSVQVGVTDGTNTFTTYSAENGNFWVLASEGSLDFGNSEARIRNADGESIMPASAGAACNNCHDKSSPLIEP